MDTVRQHNETVRWPFASGEMAQRIRSHDWAATPLGPAQHWSPSLRTIVNLMLQSPRMMALSWGGQALLLYNDAYSRLIGPRSAVALGRSAYETFADVRAVFEPYLKAALTGQTVELHDQYYPFVRTTELEDAWFDEVHHPVYLEDGTVAGVLSILEETTPRVLADRERARFQEQLQHSAAREAFLLRLSDTLRSLNDPVTVMDKASRLLGKHLGASRVMYSEVSADGAGLLVERHHVGQAVPVLTGQHRMAEFGALLLDALAAGRTVAVPDIASAPELSDGERAAYAAAGIAALAGVPLIEGGRLVALLNVHHAAPHIWTANELALIEETAGRTWAAIKQVRAERALRESEQRMRALSTATADVIYCMSPDWSEMRALEGRGLLTDIPVPNRAWLQQYIEPQDQDTVRAAVEQAIRHKAVFELEHRVRRADGSVGWTLSRAVPLLDVQGNLREWIGAASDITERKRAELARQESERRLATVFEGLPLGVALLDTAGAVMLSNQEMRCYMPTGLLPSSDDARYGRWRAYYPDGRRIECSEYAGARALRGETVLPGIDFLYTRDDGTEIWTRVAAVPLRDGEGRVTGAVVMVTDIDAAKRAEQALREMQEMQRLSAEAGRTGTWSVDPVTLDCTVSPMMAHLMGYPVEQSRVSAAQWRSSIAPEDLAGLDAALAAAIEGRNAFEHEFRVLRGDGRLLWLYSRGELVRNTDGRPVQLHGASVDVTARRHAEDASRAKSAFLAHMSHEFRTPLNAVIGLSQLLLQRSLPGDVARFVGHIHDAGEQLLALVSDVLDLSRIEAGEMQLEEAAFETAPLLESVVAMVRPQADAKGLALRSDIAPELPQRLFGDALRLRQVLLNLLGNAVKFTSAGSVTLRVRVLEVQAGQALLRFEVADTGVGIAPEQQERIFEPFTQADGSITRRYGGSGLGLSILRRLVDMMEGTLSMESQPGHGSVFSVELCLRSA